MNKNVQRGVLFATTASLWACGVGEAFAQDGARPAASSEEIIVTAQKRSERLQDVPASISALSEQQLASSGVTGTLDLQRSTAGLTFGETGTYSNFYMRGIGNAFNSTAAQSPVAMYVDGVYQAESSAMVLGLDNVERVEVVKGPQGTLYGRNAVGGAINIITKTPSKDLEARFKAGFGNLGEQQYSGYLNGGSDLVQANLAVSRHLRDGYYKNIAPNGQDLENVDELSVRGKLRFTPSATAEIIIAGDYSTQKNRGPGVVNLPIAPEPTAYLGAVYPTAALFPGAIMPTKPWQTSNTGTEVQADGRSWGLSLTGRFEFGSFDIVSISAYRDFRQTHGADFDGTNLHLVAYTSDFDTHKTFSQELQILSPSSGPFTWIAGLYYLHDLASMPFFLNQFADPPFGGVFIEQDSRQRVNSYAAFAEGTYKLAPDISLTLGARYTSDKVEHYVARQTITLTVPPMTLPTLDSSGSSRTFNAFTPKVTISYKRPEGLYYVTASKGYSAGLYNLNNILPTAAADIPVNPEKVSAIEAGAKWEFLDGRLKLNLAGFYYDMKNLQIMKIGSGGLSTFENADGESYGLDVDMSWAVMNGLMLRASAEALHARYTSYPEASSWTPNLQQGNLLVPPCGGDPTASPFDTLCANNIDATGNPLIRSPNFTSTVGFDWSLPIVPQDRGDLVLTGNWYHSDKFWLNSGGSIISPAYDSFGANLTYTSADKRWSIAVWGNNLSNAKYYQQGVEDNYGRVVKLGLSRTYGVTLTAQFGQ